MTQMEICLLIFGLTLVGFVIRKLPMWAVALAAMTALYLTGCNSEADTLGCFTNTNTLLMGTMMILSLGFSSTSLASRLCRGVMRLTRGHFLGAYFGYLLVAVVLSNLISSPLAVYVIVSAMLKTLCDENEKSRSQYMFPLMVVCLASAGILPLANAISSTASTNGLIQSYGFEGITMQVTDSFRGRWPALALLLVWAVFIGPRFTPKQPVMTRLIESKPGPEKKKRALSPFSDWAGIVIFLGAVVCMVLSDKLRLPQWCIAMIASLLMVFFGVVDHKNALREVPWDMLLLYAGSLALGTALVNTGAGAMVGNALADMLGDHPNNYLMGTIFFLIPFLLTQFMLNRSVNSIFTQICLLTCASLGANPIGPLMLVRAGALTAFLTPMATSAVPLCMADGGYDLRALLKAGFLVILLLPPVYIFYIMTVFPAF